LSSFFEARFTKDGPRGIKGLYLFFGAGEGSARMEFEERWQAADEMRGSSDGV